MRTYVEFMSRSFRSHAIYRLQYFLGLFNSILTIFIGAAIWDAVYGGRQIFEGITREEMITYSVLGMIMRAMLSMNEFVIDHKVHTGEIAADLLRPVRFLDYIFSIVLGEVLYNIWTKVLPVLILAFLIFDLVVPEQTVFIVLFVVSLVLSYFVLYSFNLIVWLSAFWVHHTWSIVTIKNALILLLSGAVIPLWFMPDWMADILAWLPFKAIYFTPLSIYLGKATLHEIWSLYIGQVLWIAVLLTIGCLIWRKAQYKLVIQGG
ncbi:ABC transporter permease [Paenibacillus ihuae]|uniref:ABC transporter permease n=1 Tax=Paenibacillus ihuae TaxID=1232431 RepID=UPI0006D5B186|nr:ABC-2 family transporter protein [Paenibacillus ihuae]